MDHYQGLKQKKPRTWKTIFLLDFLLGFGGPAGLVFLMVYLIDNKIIHTSGKDTFMVNFMVVLIVGSVVSFFRVLYLVLKKLMDF